MSEINLIESIQSLGLTNEELANYLGISIDTLKTWLYRKKEIPARKQVYVQNKISVHPNFKGVKVIINKNLTNEEFLSHLPEPVPLINPPIKDLLAQAKRMKKSKSEPTSKIIENDELVDAIEYIVPIKGQAGLASKQYPDELDSIQHSSKVIPIDFNLAQAAASHTNDRTTSIYTVKRNQRQLDYLKNIKTG